jgi:predicted amidohydrolase YtcJ
MKRLILVNGVVRQSSSSVGASALVTSDDTILAVGSDAAALAFQDASSEVVDLRGRLVLPAFTDAHTHFAAFALSRSAVDLKGVDSLVEAARRVALATARASPDGWIIGRGWSHDLWGGVQPTRQLLDAAASGRPVALSRNDGHGAWVSSEALRRANITRDTPDPAGGEVLRDESGEPSGVLTERAMDAVERLIPAPTEDDIARAVLDSIPLAHRAGLAGVTCMEGLRTYRAYRDLRDRGQLGLRIGMCLALPDFDEEVELIRREGKGDAWLHWTQLKLFADGALNPRTAWMLEPYADNPRNVGICVTPPDEMLAIVERAGRAGFACSIHAIGDAANRAVLDVFDKTREVWAPAGLRPRIEHAQTIAPSDVPRFGALGVVASMQPIHCTQDLRVNDVALGGRASRAYPFRSLLDAGAQLAFGSDTPVETFDVLAGIHAATTRRRADGFPDGGWYPRERLTVAEAVAAYTSGAAWIEGEESHRGTIAPGILADLVILSDDIVAGAPDNLLQTRVDGTIVAGQWAYRAF